MEYLRARAKADAGASECHPDSLMLTQAADLLSEQEELVASLRERIVNLQRSIQEFEVREI